MKGRIRQILRLGQPARIILFHHLPKCGGTSMVETLRKWGTVVAMYRRGWTNTPPPAPPLSTLEDGSVLVGHFELPGHHWTDIYPEALTNPRVRVMTFLRDPLRLQASLFRYERKNGVSQAATFDEHLTLRPNYMASLLHADDSNWQSILDRYWFIGVTEHAQQAFDVLGASLGKPPVEVVRTNETEVTEGDDAGLLPEETVRRFREANALDYKIYEEGIRRFEAFRPSK